MKINIQYFVSFIIAVGLFFQQLPESNAQENEIPSNNPYHVDTAGPQEIPGMRMIWNDEFNADGKPNPQNWGYEYGFVRNNQLQWYQPQNAYSRNGQLIIEGRKEKIDNPYYNPMSADWRSNRRYAEYSSASLITKGLQEWPCYGYFEFRARINTSNGSWPSISLMGSEGYFPFCGRIDIMEFYRINKVQTLLANAVWASSKGNYGEWNSVKKPLSEFLKTDPNWSKKYHIWSMKWDKETIRIFVDNYLLNEISLKKTINPDGDNPFQGNQKYYLTLNLALGSNGGNPSNCNFPVNFEIDYVRVYQYE